MHCTASDDFIRRLFLNTFIDPARDRAYIDAAEAEFRQALIRRA